MNFHQGDSYILHSWLCKAPGSKWWRFTTNQDYWHNLTNFQIIFGTGMIGYCKNVIHAFGFMLPEYNSYCYKKSICTAIWFCHNGKCFGCQLLQYSSFLRRRMKASLILLHCQFVKLLSFTWQEFWQTWTLAWLVIAKNVHAGFLLNDDTNCNKKSTMGQYGYAVMVIFWVANCYSILVASFFAMT